MTLKDAQKTTLHIIVCISMLLSFDAGAMDFHIFYQPNLKINVVVGEGMIAEGDADKFAYIAKLADRDDEGHVILALNSLGGSVSAAFKLVDAMDKVGVFTIVPENALCASACASIVYASGSRRMIVGNGRLGFHSCYSKKENVAKESSFCNEIIAENAMLRGLSHASVSLFVKEYGADDVAWLDKEVACSMLPGICKPTLKIQANPSFDCKMANKKSENLICKDLKLAELDRKMVASYKKSLNESKDRNKIQRTQRDWLKMRDQCTDVLCIKKAYVERLVELSVAQ